MDRYNKFFAALGAFLAQVVQLQLLPEEWQPWATATIAGLGALAVYQVQNTVGVKEQPAQDIYPGTPVDPENALDGGPVDSSPAVVSDDESYDAYPGDTPER